MINIDTYIKKCYNIIAQRMYKLGGSYMSLLDIHYLKKYKAMDFFINNKKFQASIQYILSDSFIISRPNKDIGNIKSGQKIQFFAMADGDLLKCESEILDVRNGESAQVLALRQPYIIQRFERRKYYRQVAVFDVDYCIFPELSNYKSVEDIPLNYLKDMKKFKLLNISGGGIMALSSENWPQGQMGMVKLLLPEQMNILVSRVRCKKVQTDDGNCIYEVALKYENITEEQRDAVIKYIYKGISNNILTSTK